MGAAGLHHGFSSKKPGMNLKKRQVDTAEQYPIPSDALKPEGFTEEIIGRWVAKDKTRTGWVLTAKNGDSFGENP